jgi:alkylglycerol monooxygenase
MKLDFIALAIPFFVSFMLLEFYISKRKSKKTHQFNESIANINVGIFERICDLLTTGTFFFVFTWLNQNFAIFKIENNWITWILLFLATDLVWYWYHRLGHEVNLLWAAHIVHHQSEDFNYTAAARITVIQAIARGIFWSILPIIGFPPHMIIILLLIHGTYPFFTHTQLIGRLGWLEFIIVTPTHHGVHHSSNEEYLDKNYGDMLIIWDKIFGTYAEETIKPQYGLTKSLGSHSFLWQHFHYFLELYVACKMAKTFKEKLKVIFGKPNDHDPRIRGYLERKLSQKVTNVLLTNRLKKAILLKTISTTIVLFLTILFSYSLPKITIYLVAFFIVLSVIITGAMLEQKRWIFHLEFLRLSLLFIIVNTTVNTIYLTEFALTIIMFTALFYKSINSKYQQFMFSS